MDSPQITAECESRGDGGGTWPVVSTRLHSKWKLLVCSSHCYISGGHPPQILDICTHMGGNLLCDLLLLLFTKDWLVTNHIVLEPKWLRVKVAQLLTTPEPHLDPSLKQASLVWTQDTILLLLSLTGITQCVNLETVR